MDLWHCDLNILLAYPWSPYIGHDILRWDYFQQMVDSTSIEDYVIVVHLFEDFLVVPELLELSNASTFHLVRMHYWLGKYTFRCLVDRYEKCQALTPYHRRVLALWLCTWIENRRNFLQDSVKKLQSKRSLTLRLMIHPDAVGCFEFSILCR